MPYMYALYVCLICAQEVGPQHAAYGAALDDLYALYVCLICMPYMYALYAGGGTTARSIRRST